MRTWTKAEQLSKEGMDSGNPLEMSILIRCPGVAPKIQNKKKFDSSLKVNQTSKWNNIWSEEMESMSYKDELKEKQQALFK